MARRDTHPKSDQQRILFIGLGFVIMSYLLNSIIDALVKGENIFRRIVSPDLKEIAVHLTFLSILFLFAAYVLNLLLKQRRLAEAGFAPMAMTQAQFADYLAREKKDLAATIAAAHITVD